MFPVDNTKIKRSWDISFSNYIEIKWRMWVLYSSKAALNYSSLYRSMHFWCHDTTLKKILSIKKLNLTWNKQTNFKKLGLLPRVFQIMWKGRRDGKFAWGGFSIGRWESKKKWFWSFEPLSKLKMTFCKYWTLIKIKISMTRVSVQRVWR